MEKYKQKIKVMQEQWNLEHGIKILNYMMDHILYQIFKIESCLKLKEDIILTI